MISDFKVMLYFVEALDYNLYPYVVRIHLRSMNPMFQINLVSNKNSDENLVLILEKSLCAILESNDWTKLQIYRILT